MSKKFLNIVIADDDADDQLLARQAICEQSAGHEINEVFNGLELLSLLKKKNREGESLPDFILLDINMPVLNGFETLALLRKDPDLKDIPVFILTTSRSESDQTYATQLGANGFYTKPILFEQLIHILEEIVHSTEIAH